MTKHVVLLLVAAALVVGVAGCHCGPPAACGSDGGCMAGSCQDSPANCQSCGGGCGMGPCAAEQAQAYERAANPGPPTAAVAYPYYTTRGPRDFLAGNPPSIGP